MHWCEDAAQWALQATIHEHRNLARVRIHPVASRADGPKTYSRTEGQDSRNFEDRMSCLTYVLTIQFVVGVGEQRLVSRNSNLKGASADRAEFSGGNRGCGGYNVSTTLRCANTDLQEVSCSVRWLVSTEIDSQCLIRAEHCRRLYGTIQ